MSGTNRTKIILVVEDDERRVRKFLNWCPRDYRILWARNAGTAIGMIKRDKGAVYAGIMLDYNLHNSPVTDVDHLFFGKDVVNAIIEHTSTDVPIFVHSTNVKNAPVMCDMLESAGFYVTKVRMPAMTQEVFDDWIHTIKVCSNDLEDDYDPALDPERRA